MSTGDPADNELHDVLAAIAVDAAPDAVLLVDGDGIIIYANAAAARQFGWPSGLVGRAVNGLVPADARERHVDHQLAYLDAPSPRPMGTGLRLHAERADGSIFPAEVSLSPAELGGATFVVATVRDVTERQEMEDRVRETEQIAAQIEERHRIVEERDRIGRDLHDSVIQELFALGMRVESRLARHSDTQVSEEAGRLVSTLDQVIRRIRDTIFDLQHPVTGASLRDEITGVVNQECSAFGLDLDLRLTGSIASIPPDVGEHLAPTLREAISNAARHGGATAVEVVVEVGNDISALVIDNGTGIDLADVWPADSDAPRHDHGEGLHNMHARAVALDGRLMVGTASKGGTRLEWRVPRRGGLRSAPR